MSKAGEIGKKIVLDGPAGAGKSTVAKILAEKLNLPYLDTGAMYRALAWQLDGKKILARQSDELIGELAAIDIALDGKKVKVNGQDVTVEIRTAHVDTIVSNYAALPAVREALLAQQRSAGSAGIVAEGRDMGTVVYPDADVKIFLTASVQERARRRYKERVVAGQEADLQEIEEQVRARDNIDSTRECAPLAVSKDAVVLDTTGMTLEQVVENILEIIEEK